eukprot:2761542-Rhodomonas_salina.1
MHEWPWQSPDSHVRSRDRQKEKIFNKPFQFLLFNFRMKSDLVNSDPRLVDKSCESRATNRGDGASLERGAGGGGVQDLQGRG